ncbi:hypothetical protein AB7M47_004155 [Bradyrhizobium elkanii]
MPVEHDFQRDRGGRNGDGEDHRAADQLDDE